MTEIGIEVDALVNRPTSSPIADTTTEFVVSVTGTADQNENPVAEKETAKATLLASARSAIERCDRSLKDAAEALGCARDDHGATQREMANAVRMSIGWVNRLLKWRDADYDQVSPFGPTTRVGRVQHAEQRSGKISVRVTAPDYRTKNDGSSQCLAQPATSKDAHSLKNGSTQRRRTALKAEIEFKYAINHWWPQLDKIGQVEITSYFNKTSSGAT